jgi:hypothetical protein
VHGGHGEGAADAGEGECHEHRAHCSEGPQRAHDLLDAPMHAESGERESAGDFAAGDCAYGRSDTSGAVYARPSVASGGGAGAFVLVRAERGHGTRAVSAVVHLPTSAGNRTLLGGLARASGSGSGLDTARLHRRRAPAKPPKVGMA